MCLRVLVMCFLNCQSWCCEGFHRKSVPVPSHALHEEPVPNIQAKPLLTQLHVSPLSPVTATTEEKISSSSPYEEPVTAMRSLLSLLQADQAK